MFLNRYHIHHPQFEVDNSASIRLSDRSGIRGSGQTKMDVKVESERNKFW